MNIMDMNKNSKKNIIYSKKEKYIFQERKTLYIPRKKNIIYFNKEIFYIFQEKNHNKIQILDLLLDKYGTW